MSLVVAWIRRLPSRDELIVASDSRLGFGARWDCCPKIFPLAREDSILAFCGQTLFAYPILLQLAKSIENYGKSESRELDIVDLRAHFLKLIERMRLEIRDFPKGDHGLDTTDFRILFAGYSSKLKKFKAWSLYYDKTASRFNHRPLSFHYKRSNGTKPFLFMGDNEDIATATLFERLKAAGKLKSGPLDMEPLDVLVEMIQVPGYDTIGGPPQIVKVYPHARVLPINVLWPITQPEYVAHFGRPLLGYEGSKYACLDLETKALMAPYEAYGRIKKPDQGSAPSDPAAAGHE